MKRGGLRRSGMRWSDIRAEYVKMSRIRQNEAGPAEWLQKGGVERAADEADWLQ